MLDLPDHITACLFDLDGVLTQTAKIHAEAWKQMFDAYLKERSERHDEPFKEFSQHDYEEYVDGKPRLDGVESFLKSRDIELSAGSAEDGPDEETVNGLGTRKNDLVLELMDTQGIEAYEGSVRFVRAAAEQGLRRAVVSSSANCKQALAAAGIEDLFEARIDGVIAEREKLEGKPAPDTFLAGAKALGVEPGQAAVFEDALVGVEAGKAGHFGWVVGVNRGDEAQGKALKEHGADVVVDDLAELMRDR